MRIDVTTVFKDLDDEPLTHNGKVWTMAEVLKHILLAPPTPPSTYDAPEHMMRLELARKVNHALVASQDGSIEDSEVDFPIERVAQMKTDACRMFGPILAAQVIPIFDGD